MNRDFDRISGSRKKKDTRAPATAQEEFAFAPEGAQPPSRPSFLETADLIATDALERHMAHLPPPSPDGDD